MHWPRSPTKWRTHDELSRISHNLECCLMSDNLRKAGSYEGNDRNYGSTDGSEELVGAHP
jgi:hypothetical protein